jgi:hypothetical protein
LLQYRRRLLLLHQVATMVGRSRRLCQLLQHRSLSLHLLQHHSLSLSLRLRQHRVDIVHQQQCRNLLAVTLRRHLK